ncbi:MAG TPA: methionine--tRNA ligase [Sedimentisphaerales bacterium]|jgi:methionyl-tRNA synthetase|nr:methionine--tRNA ligase [Sedimentisphaerales bacterium]HNU27690.1 methionine--tRNA ligase [Sedimentisphaerales bacterium]
MPRTIVVTSALPYANGPIHIGHLVEYVQTDIWIRFQRMCGNRCFYFCADDTHGTPIMISARNAGITPEQLIAGIHKEHTADFASFHVAFDNYYTTHSPENKALSELIFTRLDQAGSIAKRPVGQTYCETDKMSLPDRYVRGTCPRCGAVDQYGDSCEVCGATYRTVDLVQPRCSLCGNPPVFQESEHYFFKLADYEKQLKDLFAAGYTQKSVANKLDEWFTAGLKDWDISRDGPYFGFKIPGEDNKYFYVWLDAPIGYMASARNYCERHGLNFDELWNSPANELYHFIGKDIMYFHALFWPAMLMGSRFKTANKLFVHGFLTVNGEKMSKSRGTFIKAGTYAKHLDPECLRYYYASKLTDAVEDIDLSFQDFVGKTNSDLVGKYANLASRSGPMLTRQFGGRLGVLDAEGRELVACLTAVQEQIVAGYEGLNYATVVRTISALADDANRYVEQNQPWATAKTDPARALTTLTAVLNAVRVLTIYLKPILPVFAQKVEKFLGVGPLQFADVEKTLENHQIGAFERLFERIDEDKVTAMVEESKEGQAPSAAVPAAPTAAAASVPPHVGGVEPIKPECTIDDFAKIDLRVAKVLSAERVAGADKLIHLVLETGLGQRNVMAGIATAYEPESLVGRHVVYFANLKPRKMKFGLSEGMILASGSGGKEIFVLSPDAGAVPGQQIH